MTAETKEAALYMGPWDKFKDLFKTGDNKKMMLSLTVETCPLIILRSSAFEQLGKGEQMTPPPLLRKDPLSKIFVKFFGGQ